MKTVKDLMESKVEIEPEMMDKLKALLRRSFRYATEEMSDRDVQKLKQLDAIDIADSHVGIAGGDKDAIALYKTLSFDQQGDVLKATFDKPATWRNI